MAVVNREQFLTKLQMIEPGLSNKESIAQATSFVFRDGYAMAFNNKIGARIKSGLPKDLKCAVPGKELLDILPMMPEDTVDIETTENQMIVNGFGRRLKLALEADILLGIDTIDQSTDWYEIPPSFNEALAIVISCLGKDEKSGYILTCMHFTPKYIQSCDNLQMVRYRVNIGLQKECLVEGEKLRYVVEFGMTEFSETDSWLHFKNQAGLILSYRRSFQEFYKLDHHLEPPVNGEQATLPSGLHEAIQRAGKIAATSGKTTKILVELSPNKLKLTAVGAVSEYEEETAIKYEGRSMTFMISPIVFESISRKHNAIALCESKLLVDGGKFKYISVLASPKNPATEAKKNERAQSKSKESASAD